MENDSRKPEKTGKPDLNNPKTLVVHRLPYEGSANKDGMPRDKRALQGRLKGIHRIVYSLN